VLVTTRGDPSESGRRVEPTVGRSIAEAATSRESRPLARVRLDEAFLAYDISPRRHSEPPGLCVVRSRTNRRVNLRDSQRPLEREYRRLARRIVLLFTKRGDPCESGRRVEPTVRWSIAEAATSRETGRQRASDSAKRSLLTT
jgi:hypothetical protein